MIPEHIRTAVNALLAPYGETYSPTTRQREYLSPKEAAGYLGVSIGKLNLEVRAGKIKKRKFMDSRNGMVKYEKSELDRYMDSL